ncbi:MAG TPA: NAD(P)H-hydrate epimerase [Phycisphaerae bacterium]|nr:NAD(P)H-hydrate epimerase [Phycisphaerae bacterium]
MSADPRSLSRDEVRSVDRYAIETLGVPGVVLMENAGRNAADAIERFLGGAKAKSVAVVAGAGNNGGDGFVIARHLHLRGARVVVFLVADRQKLAADAAVNLGIIEKLGLDVRPAGGANLNKLADELRRFDLIVDAVGGTGIRGALRGETAAAVEQINAAGRPVVAVDIPTGLDCDTGAAAGPAVKADMTVTFVARKKGFDAPGAERYTGTVVVADIGVPPPGA